MEDFESEALYLLFYVVLLLFAHDVPVVHEDRPEVKEVDEVYLIDCPE
jgi:hypothetical protein